MDDSHKAAIDKYTSSHNGVPLDRESLLRPSPMVQKMLLARIGSMNEQEQASFKNIITPETEGALRKLIPELGAMINKGVVNAQG